MTGRELALKALMQFRRNKTRAETAFTALSDKSVISKREKALAMRIFYGVIQNTAYCDYLISCYSDLDLRKIEPVILDLLRLSVYQIVFLQRVPHSAIVNEGVLLAKKHSNPRGAGFVNAVLRCVAGNAANNTLPEVTGGNEYYRLSVKYSHPEWLVRQFCLLLGSDGAEQLLKANNDGALPLTAQINTLRTDKKTVKSMLVSANIETFDNDLIEDCIEMVNPGNIGDLVVFNKGFINIQDTAARLAVAAADPKPGDFVIDGCAAPGGKSFAAAMDMKNSGHITACDINPEKLKQIENGARRLGINIIETREADSTQSIKEFTGRADLVIADVPCSGFGVIRKKPDIRYKPQETITGLPGVQAKILKNLSSYVKQGGRLLYSTCTVFECENEDIVGDFLYNNPDFTAESFYLPGLGQAQSGMLRLWPHIHGTDGFFICKLRRTGSNAVTY